MAAAYCYVFWRPSLTPTGTSSLPLAAPHKSLNVVVGDGHALWLRCHKRRYLLAFSNAVLATESLELLLQPMNGGVCFTQVNNQLLLIVVPAVVYLQLSLGDVFGFRQVLDPAVLPLDLAF